MPFSWVKVSSYTSHRIRQCMGDERSKRRFSECVSALVEREGGRVDAVWFELNGKFAHVSFYYENEEQRTNIIFDLEAEDVIDLVTPEEVDHRTRHRSEAD
jgi:hypothetical protein